MRRDGVRAADEHALRDARWAGDRADLDRTVLTAEHPGRRDRGDQAPGDALSVEAIDRLDPLGPKSRGFVSYATLYFPHAWSVFHCVATPRIPAQVGQ